MIFSLGASPTRCEGCLVCFPGVLWPENLRFLEAGALVGKRSENLRVFWKLVLCSMVSSFLCVFGKCFGNRCFPF